MSASNHNHHRVGIETDANLRSRSNDFKVELPHEALNNVLLSQNNDVSMTSLDTGVCCLPATSTYPAELLSRLDSLRSRSAYTDAVLCVGESEFPCHRNVLAASSRFFDAMFSSSLRESHECRVPLHDISPIILRRLLDFVYSGNIEVDSDSAQDLLAAATFYQYPAIVSACCRFIIASLHPSNCLGIESFAKHHACNALLATAHKYILENFVAVSQSEEFLELSLDRLVSYVESDLIEVRDEEFIFTAIACWVNADPDHRSGADMCTLVSHVRFAFIDWDYVEHIVLPHPHIASCNTCMERVRLSGVLKNRTAGEATTDSSLRCRKGSVEEICAALAGCEIFPLVLNPRPSTTAKEVMVVIGGVGLCEGTDIPPTVITSMEAFDPVKDRWISLPNLPMAVINFSATAFENDIYVIGGEVEGRGLVGNVWRYISRKRRWVAGPSLRTPRSSHASAAWGTRLHVIGGINVLGNPMSPAEETIECLDLSLTNPTWAVIEHIPLPRQLSQVIPYSTSLVEIGGTVDRFPSKRMETYECNLTGFKYSGEQYVLPDEIQYSKFALVDGCFYIIWEDTRKVIALNPTKRTYKRVADIGHARRYSGATVLLKHRLYVCGGETIANSTTPGAGGRGETWSTPCDTVEYYNSETDIWTVSQPMPTARARHGCVTILMS